MWVLSQAEDGEGATTMNGCRFCGSTIQPRQGRGPKRTCCDAAACVKKRKSGNQEVRKAYYIKQYAKPSKKQCAVCGIDFMSMRGRRYCSDVCLKARAVQRDQSRNGYRNRVWKRTTVVLPCRYCGVITEKQQKNVCGAVACQLKRNREKGYRWHAKNGKDYQCKVQSRKRKARALLSRFCIVCLERFSERRSNVLCCSLDCIRMRLKARSITIRAGRRYVFGYLRRATIDWLLDRDKGRCQLCLRRVVRKAQRTKLSPSIDHIVPVSKGGGNEDSNLQLAHLYCNMKKSAKIKGQFRLW